MAHLNIDLNDLTTSALKRLVTQLITAKDGDEQKILDRLKHKSAPHKSSAKNDLADLHEEMHGKPNTPMVDDEPDPFDLNEDSEGEEEPKVQKRGKK